MATLVFSVDMYLHTQNHKSSWSVLAGRFLLCWGISGVPELAFRETLHPIQRLNLCKYTDTHYTISYNPLAWSILCTASEAASLLKKLREHHQYSIPPVSHPLIFVINISCIQSSIYKHPPPPMHPICTKKLYISSQSAQPLLLICFRAQQNIAYRGISKVFILISPSHMHMILEVNPLVWRQICLIFFVVSPIKSS